MFFDADSTDTSVNAVVVTERGDTNDADSSSPTTRTNPPAGIDRAGTIGPTELDVHGIPTWWSGEPAAPNPPIGSTAPTAIGPTELDVHGIPTWWSGEPAAALRTHRSDRPRRLRSGRPNSTCTASRPGGPANQPPPNERILVPEIPANHGLGPVWYPDGDRIVYQRLGEHTMANPSKPSREEHEVVLVTVSEDDPLEPAGTTWSSRHRIPPDPTGSPVVVSVQCQVVSVQCHVVA